jgi:uncharacterized integral membrane protein
MEWASDFLLIVVLLLVVVQGYFLVRFTSFASRVEELLTELARK